MRIRIISTGSGKQAIQVVSKVGRDLYIHKHVGTFATQSEKDQLLETAQSFIESDSNQPSLFSIIPDNWTLGEIEFVSSQPLYLYNLLSAVYSSLGFPDDPLVRDLVVARLYQPASKRETNEILTDVFGVSYSLRTIYRHLKTMIDDGLKTKFQEALVAYARHSLGDPLRLVFYDVTTLAFSSQTKTSLKDFGFSKDHRFQDTQIVLGLVVNSQGFPLYFDVFSGNTFEGSTFIKVVEGIKKLLGADDLVVVADAGMLSKKNMDELNEAHTWFVVGARIANLPLSLLNQLSHDLGHRDGAMTDVTHQEYRLIVDYSAKRAKKDLLDINRQWIKAKTAIEKPSGIVRRYRFIQGSKHSKYTLNPNLKEKATMIAGTKGYLTNTQLSPSLITSKYRDLWKVEKAFRITKSDLEARPIFLKLDSTIKAHLTIVFAGLATARLLEIQTNTSIHQILKVTSKILTHTIRHIKSQSTTTVQTTPTDSAKILCGKLSDIYHVGY